MSVLHVNQIISKVKSLFELFVDMKDIPAHDPERESKMITRCLAAYAVYHHVACTAEDAAKAVVDMGDDNGIDAIFYSSALKELVLVQSKYIKNGSGEPDSGEIGKFCTGVEDLINERFDRFNKKINDRSAQISSAILNFETKYILILIYTGDKGLADHGQRKIDDLVNELNDAGEGSVEPLVKFKKFDQGGIYSSLTKGLLQEPLNIEIGLFQWGKYTEPFNAYFGYMSGEEIARLWIDSGRKLFHRNIRNVLGKTDVNDELIQTIIKAPAKFWYFNNGITIIADDVVKSLQGGTSRESGSFKLTNASVVNGAQTISTIGEMSTLHSDQLKQIFVLVRCISLKGAIAEFGNEVTKANNRQNRIENRDFVSQDSQQTRLKEELAHDNVNYSIVRSDSFTRSKLSFDVEEATASLACASKNVGLAVQMKREPGKFYEDLSKGIYRQIFNASVTGRYVFNAVEINRNIEKAINTKLVEVGKKSGREYGILVHGNRMISMLIFVKLRVSSNELMDVGAINLQETFDQTFSKLVEVVSQKYPDAILATLFKNKAKCEIIEKEI